jgi:glutamate formiminotransferase/formiminotetrahydrofolate cyclodeaminase
LETKKTLRAFATDLASATPTPGGGSAAALAGVLAAALAAMVGRFTAGRKRFAEVSEAVEMAISRADTAREGLLALVDEDANAYGAVVAAQELPRATDDQKSKRASALQEALVGAARVPLKVVVYCSELLALSAEMARIGNPSLVSDAGVAAVMAEAGLQAAALNVKANLPYLTDESAREGLSAELDLHSRGATKRRDEVLALVEARASGGR